MAVTGPMGPIVLAAPTSWPAPPNMLLVLTMTVKLGISKKELRVI